MVDDGAYADVAINLADSKGVAQFWPKHFC
jgi:hypothetical protein